MHRIQIIGCLRLILLIAFILSSLSARSKDNDQTNLVHAEESSENGEKNKETEVKMDEKIRITIGNSIFSATLENNETAKTWVEMLPMTLVMNELNGNEKYHYLSFSLPTNASNPATIHAGDIMLYGSSCLVVFYKTFDTSYSYTKIGHIDNPANLADVVGNGNISIKFEPEQSTVISETKEITHNEGNR
ncbi:MAG: cyclophilin-like fold protein [Prevotella sp.]